VESLISVFVVFCGVILSAVHSPQLNFETYTCEKVVHRFRVIFIGQINVLALTVSIVRYDLSLMIIYIYIYIYMLMRTTCVLSK
jgi:hypothetical protein